LAETAARERGRFGRELHDGLGQELTGLGYLATLLHKQLHVSGDPRADMAKQLARGIQSAIDSARQIARGVAPVGPEPGGLVAALERLVASSHAYFGTPCCFRCRGPVEVEDATVAGELFRIAQEAVTNAARHAGAKHIEVELAREADAVSLVVRDDGVGLPNDLSQSAGMGLRIMRYRAGLIGADLDVRSSDGGGTEIACTVPREGMDNVP
jgi:signal transduction histidine kinase